MADDTSLKTALAIINGGLLPMAGWVIATVRGYRKERAEAEQRRRDAAEARHAEQRTDAAEIKEALLGIGSEIRGVRAAVAAHHDELVDHGARLDSLERRGADVTRVDRPRNGGDG